MTCDEFELLWLTESKESAACFTHRSTCENCQRFASDATTILANVRMEQRDVAPASSMAEKIWKKSERLSVRRKFGWAGAAAAALALCVGAASFLVVRDASLESRTALLETTEEDVNESSYFVIDGDEQSDADADELWAMEVPYVE